MKLVLVAALFVSACVTGSAARSESWIGADGPTYTTVLQKGPAHKLGLNVPEGWESRKVRASLPEMVGELPAKFSWQDKLTPIRNQGNCGSCWAFSAQATIADVLALHGKGSLDLSEQWLVSCDKESSGCGGGWYHSAFDLVRSQGNVLEKDMPYTQSNGSCKAVPHTYKLVAFKELSAGVATIAAIKQAVYMYGPISVAVSVSGGFDSYKSGIFNEGASGTINHATNIVGWDDTEKPAHWIMRNSWGSSWGENGYMRIAYGSKKIGYAAAYVDIFGPIPHGDPTPNPTPAPSPTPSPEPTPKPCPDCPPCNFWRAIMNLFGV